MTVNTTEINDIVSEFRLLATNSTFQCHQVGSIGNDFSTTNRCYDLILICKTDRIPAGGAAWGFFGESLNERKVTEHALWRGPRIISERPMLSTPCN